jgi:hypothetical protein
MTHPVLPEMVGTLALCPPYGFADATLNADFTCPKSMLDNGKSGCKTARIT